MAVCSWYLFLLRSVWIIFVLGGSWDGWLNQAVKMSWGHQNERITILIRLLNWIVLTVNKDALVLYWHKMSTTWATSLDLYKNGDNQKSRKLIKYDVLMPCVRNTSTRPLHVCIQEPFDADGNSLETFCSRRLCFRGLANRKVSVVLAKKN